MSTILEQTIESDVPPIEMLFEPIKTTGESYETAFRSEVRINSLELGTLLPTQYRFVADRTKQTEDLAEWSFHELYRRGDELLAGGKSFEWISVYVPVRMLKGGMVSAMLERIRTESKTVLRKEKICLEFTPDLLLDYSEERKKDIEGLSEEGYRIAICDFGEDLCPVRKMADIPVDIVFLHPQVTLDMAENPKSVEALVSFLNVLGVYTVMGGVSDPNTVSALAYWRCHAYSDDLYLTVSDLIGGGGEV